jgi:hypothetical protein
VPEDAVPDMAEARTFYNREYYRGLTWWFVRDEIGLGLRERYQVAKDLPPSLLPSNPKTPASLLRFAPV